MAFWFYHQESVAGVSRSPDQSPFGLSLHRKGGKQTCVTGFVAMILYSNCIAPIASIPGNVVQVITAGIIVLPIITALKKTVLKQIGGIE